MSNTAARFYTKKTRRRTVLLRAEVYEKLRENGKFGDSFSDIVNRLIDGREKSRKRNEEDAQEADDNK